MLIKLADNWQVIHFEGRFDTESQNMTIRMGFNASLTIMLHILHSQ